MATTTTDTERRLWDAADSFRANSNLKSSEYSVPVLGLIFLRYADFKFAQAEKALAAKGSGRRAIGKEGLHIFHHSPSYSGSPPSFLSPQPKAIPCVNPLPARGLVS